MSISPEYPDPYYSSPQHLSEVPSGLNREGLVPLTIDQLEFCNFWYDEVEYRTEPGNRPQDITATNESRFAHTVHRLVADSVSIERRSTHTLIIPRAEVTRNLDAYYERFPADAEPSDADQGIRREYQDTMLEAARVHTDTYGELEVVSALCRAFRDRHQRHSTRAMFGLLTAYGHTINGVIDQ